jgi:signal transduction histidine kinase
VGIEDSAWFGSDPDCAIDDFLAVCEQCLASGASLHGAARLELESLAPTAQDLRAWLELARIRAWGQLEHHLEALAATHARVAGALAALHGFARQLYRTVSAAAVAWFASEPARLTHVLHVLGEALERSLAILARDRHGDPTPSRRADVSTELHDEVLEPAQLGMRSEHDQLEQTPAAAREVLDQQSAARLAALSQTAHEFAVESGELAPLLTLVAQRIAEAVRDGATVRLISLDGAWLEPTASFYHPDPKVCELIRPVLASQRQRLGEGVSGRVAATGVPVLIPVVNADLRPSLAPPAFRPILAHVPVASLLAVPLRSRGRTIGVVSLVRSEPGHPYTLDDQHHAQDLCDRAALAIDNAALVATLEQQVAERTAALEAANRELEAFSYSASHDLRTPLRAIDGFSQMLLEEYQDRLDPRGQDYLRRIRAATQRMGGLIEDLLKLARITRVTLNVAVHDLSALAADIVAELQRRDPHRTIPVHIAPGLAARADGRLLRILLDNLLGNAWKFTAKHDHAQIWVGAEADACYVRDTGAGFDMTYSTKLFAPFERLHSATEYEGSGVGLAIAQRIVAHHGGRIWATAEVGQGATFYFALGTNPR